MTTYGIQDQMGLWLVAASFQYGRDVHTDAGPRHRALAFSDRVRALALVKALEDPESRHQWKVTEFAPRPSTQRIRESLHLPATATEDEVIAAVVELVGMARVK
jgi:hypothetical protein